MKRFLWITILLSFFMITNGYAEFVNRQKAEQVAINWYESFGKEAIIETGIEREYNGHTSFYIFSFKNGGFVMVSAEDATVPILGYSVNSEIVEEITHPALKEWLSRYDKEIDLAISENRDNRQTIEKWQRILSDNISELRGSRDVSPLLSTEWDQCWPYNGYCPEDADADAWYLNEHVLAGCVATAMSQIMKYHAYPQQGLGLHSYVPETHPEYGTQTANFAETTYDWSNMPNTPSPYDELNEDLATIIYHAGVASEMDYTPTGSGAYTQEAALSLISHFNYDTTTTYLKKEDYSDSDWKSMMRDELDNARPMLYSGSGAGGGHAFVCDGYQGTDYFHFNWGWSGSYDGYYYLDALTPGDHDYTWNQKAVVGIQPNSSSSTYPLYTSFEGMAFLGWSVVDNDDDGNDWSFYSISHTGDIGMGVEYNSEGNDDWLITPQLELPAGNFITFSFWSKSYSSGLLEDFNLKLSTTGNDIEDFTVQLDDVNSVPSDWTQYTYDLSDYAGQSVYLAVQCVSHDQYYLFADDFKMIATPIPETVETPEFSPEAGTYLGEQAVTISCATPDADIHYTTDGSDPTQSDAVYTNPINLTQPTTLKARAYKGGWTPSEIAIATYEIIELEPEIFTEPENGETLNFGEILVNTTTIDSVKIKNLGNDDLAIDSLLISGDAFSIHGSRQLILLSPNDSTFVLMDFSPQSIGEKTGNLTIKSNDADESSVSISLSGSAMAPQISVSDESLEFGRIEAGNFETRSFSVENTGTADLHISQFNFGESDRFEVLESPPITLAPDSSKTLTIRFSAELDEDIVSDTLHIISDAYNQGETEIELAGVSIQAPEVSIPNDRALFEDLPAVIFADLDSFVVDQDGHDVSWAVINFDSDKLDSVKLGVDNSVTAFPKSNQFGDVWAKFTATDPDGLWDSDSVSFHIQPTNDPPEFTSTPIITATQDSLYRYDITSSDIDIGDVLAITGSYPDWLILTDNGDGTATLSGTPLPEHVGEYGVNLVVMDNETDTDTQNFTITVYETPPEFTGDFNVDSRIDMLDLQMLISHLNGEYNEDFDIVTDGVIDFEDVRQLLDVMFSEVE